MSNEWKNITNGSFRGVPFHAAIPGDTPAGASDAMMSGVASRTGTYERRLQQIVRPLVDGAGVKDWGANARVFTAEIHFFGPNYLDEYAKFQDAISQGTAGTLILPDVPKAINAYFWKLDERAGHQDGSSIVVTATWIEAIAPAGKDSKQDGPINKKSFLDSAIDTATKVISNNPLFLAIRAAESGLSVARSAVNFALTLDHGIRNRITQLQAEVTSTLALVKQGSNEVMSDFHRAGPAASEANAKAKKDLGIDKSTGRPVADFTEPDTLPTEKDPLTPPETKSSVAVNASNLTTELGIQAFSDQAIAVIRARRDELSSLSQGRCDDVAKALTAVVNALQDFVAVTITKETVTFTVPSTMSLAEVLFINHVSLDNLNAIRQKNTHVDDCMVIPPGTVISL